MKPVIGLTCNFDENQGNYILKSYYISSIHQAGGIPILLPPVEDETAINEYIKFCNGLIFTGGGDLDPYHWGELPRRGLGEINPLRDKFELLLIQNAIKQQIPVLGICRGCQVINVAAGGSLIQDLRGMMSHQQNAPRNYPMHMVFIKNNSILESIIQNNRIRVNSFHHQAVKSPGNGLQISAYSADGVIEAIENINLPFLVGVQWHPECLEDEYSSKIFKAIIEAALVY